VSLSALERTLLVAAIFLGLFAFLASPRLARQTQQTIHLSLRDGKGPLRSVKLSQNVPNTARLPPTFDFGCTPTQYEFGSGVGATNFRGEFIFRNLAFTAGNRRSSTSQQPAYTYPVTICFWRGGQWQLLILLTRDRGGVRRLNVACQFADDGGHDCTSALQMAPDEWAFRYLVPGLAIVWGLRLLVRRSLPAYRSSGLWFTGFLLAAWMTYSIRGFPLASYPLVFGLVGWLAVAHVKLWRDNRKWGIPGWI
jgi:hypothetical protein